MACGAGRMTASTLADVDIVALTVWHHEHSGLPDPFATALAKEVARRGGPADVALVRDWLRKQAADREARAAARGEPIGPRPGHAQRWVRVADCACGGKTRQVLHGFTDFGRLWKGHACKCRGWQCCDCGRILDRQSECCR
jgi:hypothetical protein